MATKSVATTAKRTVNRQPSPFRDTTRVTVKCHANVSSVTPDEIEQVLRNSGMFDHLAVRFVSRSKGSSPADGVRSLSVYLAPQGYQYPEDKTPTGGVKLDADTASMFRSLAAAAGLDPKDPESIRKIARALAERASR